MQPHPPPWPICFGLETELGITVMEDPEADVVEESIALVRSAAQHGVANLWDYATEDPHRDARGFRAAELRQDTDEANYYSQDARRELTFQEIKSDLVLRNGARFYNDHAHPEYSTPECATLVDLIAQDKAGERLLEECARVVTRRGSRTVKLYKNNTDFRGHSYGCHDNYLIPRVIPWDRLVHAMTPFLVTRQLYAGAGKVGWECENNGGAGGFQISQRADFFSELVSIDTMNRRPLINTRDEPHADPSRFRRFHCIVGDSNLSQFATWLKIGTTALMLESLEHEGAPEWWSLADPLEAHRSISRDESFQWNVPLAGGKTIRAVDLQHEFIRWVEKRVDLGHPEKRKVLADWKETVSTLESNPLSLHDRLDWAAKRHLLDAFREQEKRVGQSLAAEPRSRVPSAQARRGSFLRLGSERPDEDADRRGADHPRRAASARRLTRLPARPQRAQVRQGNEDRPVGQSRLQGGRQHVPARHEPGLPRHAPRGNGRRHGPRENDP
jgi:hypothetical protein